MKKRAGFGNEKGVAVLVALFLLVLFSFLLLTIAHQISATSLGTVQMRYRGVTENFAGGGMNYLVNYFTQHPNDTTLIEPDGTNHNYSGFDADTGDSVDSTFTGAMTTSSALQALTPPASYHALSQDILLTAIGKRKADGATVPDSLTIANRKNETVLNQRHRRGSYIDSLNGSGASDWEGDTGGSPAQFAPVEAMDGDLDTNVDHATTPIQRQVSTAGSGGSGSWRSNGSGVNYSLIIDFGQPEWPNAIRWFQTRDFFIRTAAIDRWDDATQTWIEIVNNNISPLPQPGGNPGLYEWIPEGSWNDYLNPFYTQTGGVNTCSGGCHPNIWRGRGATHFSSINHGGGVFTTTYRHSYSDLDNSDLDSVKFEETMWCSGPWCSGSSVEDPPPTAADYIAFMTFTVPVTGTRALRFRILSVGPAAGNQAQIHILGVYNNQDQSQPANGTTNLNLIGRTDLNVGSREGRFRPEGRRVP